MEDGAEEGCTDSGIHQRGGRVHVWGGGKIWMPANLMG